MLDVGSQKSERKKWIHCFDKTEAVLFVAALSDFDLTLLEDPSISRLQESLKLFEPICNNRWFVSSCMILFLNKTDLFKQKLQRGSTGITTCFPHYKGDPKSYEDVTAFIEVIIQKGMATEQFLPIFGFKSSSSATIIRTTFCLKYFYF
jgi:hypothetical protein